MQISGLSLHRPDRFMPASELSALSGIPEDVLTEKFGFTGKFVSGADEHASDMCVDAARPLLASAEGKSPIGTVIYCGSSIKDYSMWSCAAQVTHELGLDGAFAFEVMGQCAGMLIAAWTAQALMTVDSDDRDVLLVAASKDSTVVDYDDPSVKSVFNFGDGAAALRMSRNGGGARILSHAAITDGTFHDSVMVPAGGTVEPASVETVAAGRHRAHVKPGLSLRESVTPMFVANMTEAARLACERGGVGEHEIDHVLIQNQIPSVHRAILDRLGTPPAACRYFGGHGHMSSLDPIFALGELAASGHARPGDRLLLLAAGLGYTASALLLEWSGDMEVHTAAVIDARR